MLGAGDGRHRGWPTNRLMNCTWQSPACVPQPSASSADHGRALRGLVSPGDKAPQGSSPER